MGALDFLNAGVQVGSMIYQNEVNKKAAKRQAAENMKLAVYQNDANARFLAQQNEYNSPLNQMSRFKAAGLNPNLIYGQGNPGNQSSPQQAADIRPADYQSHAMNLSALLPMFNQTKMVQAQVDALKAKTVQTYGMVQLNKLQKQVLEKNPLLNESGFTAIIDSLKSAAQIKAADSSIKSQLAEWSTGEKSFKIDGIEMHGPAGAAKLEVELNTMLKKYDLSTQDQAIKSEILKSKQFQNDILEVQKRFMTDGDITPQHILMFIQLLLTKLL
ncbi:MAG: DNA pilot protein [Microviridae sp.]|nr:MAG: DNA pilot protein [Microviridae sp.]